MAARVHYLTRGGPSMTTWSLNRAMSGTSRCRVSSAPDHENRGVVTAMAQLRPVERDPCGSASMS